VRIVLDAGRVRVDPQMTRPGRGAYLHPDPACIEAAAKRGALARALRASIGADEVSNLKGHIVGEEGR